MTAVAEYENAHKHWSAFNLTSKKDALDAAALSITDEDERAINQRKVLASMTRDFKSQPTYQSTNQAIKQSIGTLLKAYQEEINALTKRSQSIEKSYLSVYVDLINAPDPAPLFNQTINQSINQAKRIAELESNNQSINQQLNDYEAEFSTLKNQDSTIRRLESELKQSNDQVNQLINQINQLNNQINQSNNQSSDIETERADWDVQRQMLEHKIERMIERSNERERAYQTQQSSWLVESESINQSIKQFERECEELRSENEQLAQQLLLQKEHVSKSDQSINQSINDTINQSIEAEVASYRRSLTRAQEQLAASQKLSNEQSNQINYLQSELEAAQQTIDQLNEQSNNQSKLLPTVDQWIAVQKQLKTLESMHEASVNQSNKQSISQSIKQSLDRTQSELSQVRSELIECKHQNDQLLVQLKEKQDEIISQSSMISTLEADLNIAQSINQSINQSILHSKPKSTRLVDANQSNNQSSVIDIPEDSSFVTLVVNQRDRLRARVDECEQIINQLRSDNDVLMRSSQEKQAENLQLYEKLVYVKSMNDNQSNNQTINQSINQSIDDKYSKLYQASNNPFLAFKQRLMADQKTNLAVTERALLAVFQIVSSRKAARTCTVIYVIILHLLVSAVLYTHTIQDHCGPREMHEN